MTRVPFAPEPAAADPQPLRLHEAVVEADWVDYNGHMNVAWYVLVFDQATDAVLDALALGGDYRAATGCSVFVAEAHVLYEDEVVLGERLAVTSRLLDFDGKRLILFHEMFRTGSGARVATNELLCLHVDLATRRTAPFDPAAGARIQTLAAAHAVLPRPPQAGRAIGLGNRRPARP